MFSCSVLYRKWYINADEVDDFVNSETVKIYQTREVVDLWPIPILFCVG